MNQLFYQLTILLMTLTLLACQPVSQTPGDAATVSAATTAAQTDAAAANQPASARSTDPSAPIQVMDRYNDYTVDQNQNGLFESLHIEVEVNVAQAGEYSVGGTLSIGNETEIFRDIDGTQQWLYLDSGTQTVTLSFGGPYIARSQQNGPYQLNNLWITNIQNPTPIQLRTNLIDAREIAYITNSYTFEQFEVGE